MDNIIDITGIDDDEDDDTSLLLPSPLAAAAAAAAASTSTHRQQQNESTNSSVTPQTAKSSESKPVSVEDASRYDGEAVDTFSQYTPPEWIQKLRPRKEVDHDAQSYTAKSHSSPACESGLLSSVCGPIPSDACLEVVRDLYEEGNLSALQLEGSALAIQRHCRLLSANESGIRMRSGFFLGDGAGVGKGRQIAAVLRDSFSRSVKRQRAGGTSFTRRRRHLWLSVSRELAEDARRDLKDVGCFVPVVDAVEILGRSNSKGFGYDDCTKGAVLFSTYSLLVSGRGKKMEEIISWLTNNDGREAELKFDGLIIFDEAHKAKNLAADPPTQTGRLVLAIQERLPNARVMYCSATGVSSLKQMAYAVRLGLWGPGTSFGSFENFRASLEKGGVGAMEMLALEMKQHGCFVARTLSWDGAEFESIETKLLKEQEEVYDKAMEWWNDVQVSIKEALAEPDMGATPRMLWSQFWSAHQRFSRELAICAKIPFVADDSLKQLRNGRCVVIGLQSTGEASTQAALEELSSKINSSKGSMKLDDIYLEGIVSTSASIMTTFMRKNFPVAPTPKEPLKVPSIPPNGFANEFEREVYVQMARESKMMKNLLPPQPKQELIRKREELINRIAQIPLPPSPLDDLIDRLGGVETVAEMTGRSIRIVRVPCTNKFKFVKRFTKMKESKYGLSMPSESDETDLLNVTEKKDFMEGRKSIAIISDAASTGISLHSASTSASKDKRRVHYTIELPWSADKAIQQLGRSHRSGQTSAPIYKIIISELGGERRFAASVAKKMSSLGALTKGDRRAASGSDFSSFDIDSKFGRLALQRFYDCMASEPPYNPSKGSNSLLDKCSVSLNIKESSDNDRRSHILSVAKSCLEKVGIKYAESRQVNGGVKLFLNRISALSVVTQNLVFHLFMSTFDDIIAEAKDSGIFEGSVEDFRAKSIEFDGKPIKCSIDPSSRARTKYNKFNVDRGCSFEEVLRIALPLLLDDSIEGTDSCTQNCTVAKSGFYISKNLIMGRRIVLFAKKKFNGNENDFENMINYDPTALMILTRPNTGTNPIGISSADLLRKYKLVESIDDIKSKIEHNVNISAFIEVMQKKHTSFCNLWNKLYNASNNFEGEAGIAPRKSKLVLITGAVLHCLLALEKVVASRKLSERVLKVVRVELSSSGERIVGVKFPADTEAKQSLCIALKDLEASRTRLLKCMYIDEQPDCIQSKSIMWLKSRPKTLLSFFGGKVVNIRNDSHGEPREKSSKKMKINASQKKRSMDSCSITSFFNKKY